MDYFRKTPEITEKSVPIIPEDLKKRMDIGLDEKNAEKAAIGKQPDFEIQ